ncbi:hypothetical protein TNCV_3621561 [Trichonephila clavipes]|nr:hypothetical protein TNCV_3621561 [Trichonephila clavipes]
MSLALIRSDLNDAGVLVDSKTIRRRLADARLKECSLLDVRAADSDKETNGSTSVDRAANLLAVIRTWGTSVDNGEAEVFS